MSVLTSLTCPLCGVTHDADETYRQFYSFACEKYGEIEISRRARVEYERHPHRLAGAREAALQCKQLEGRFSVMYDVPDGLRLECISCKKK